MLVDVQNVTKSYRGKDKVLRDVSFGLNKGECLGLVGESGCGKSTLARCLMRMETIEKGSILFNGEAIEKLPERKLRSIRKNMQIVFQNPTASLNPKLKIKDSLMDAYDQLKGEADLTYFQYTSREGFVKQLLEAVELPGDLANRYPHELSGGQRQRVTIARAISIEPELIVLDEPTASLDVLSQGVVLQLLTDLRKRLNLSYLFISHDLAAVQQMSQRTMVMKDGSVVDVFDQEHIFSEARHPYTKELISIF
ncbi:ABC transporter ATP-binding protein [Oceanobacillus kapialis]|uniref:ABC transporter ATP-binding protein n=1 Tax=Oceanobacillus kapialis TaxID=481353 RepID=UPI00384CC20D